MAIDDTLVTGEVFSAHDEQGSRYVIARTSVATWLCAPISELALSCLTSGRAELRAVFAHSRTGMVERLTVWGATVREESLVPCAELTDDVLPKAGLRLRERVRCA
jgi:hypothetical protein